MHFYYSHQNAFVFFLNIWLQRETHFWTDAELGVEVKDVVDSGPGLAFVRWDTLPWVLDVSCEIKNIHTGLWTRLGWENTLRRTIYWPIRKGHILAFVRGEVFRIIRTWFSFVQGDKNKLKGPGFAFKKEHNKVFPRIKIASNKCHIFTGNPAWARLCQQRRSGF